MPSDKSIAHRALFLGAVADGLTRILGREIGADNRSTIGVLRSLGVPVREGAGGEIRIAGGGWAGLRAPAGFLDCGNSGTTMRLGAGVLAGRPFEATLTGDASLSRRPMRRIIEPLRAMGAEVESRGPGGCPPLVVRGGRLRGIRYTLPMASAQVKSAVLLAGLQAEGETTVVEPEPTRDHTERLLRDFGVDVRIEPAVDGPQGAGRRITVGGGARLRGQTVSLPGDVSSAAFFVVAGLLVEGSEIEIADVGLNPTRTAYLDVLREMGGAVDIEPARAATGGEPFGTIRVRASRLRGVTVAPALVPRLIDEVPILCIAAACAVGPTTVTGATELRVKESDRLAVMARALRDRGVGVEERPDGLVIEGAGERLPLRGGRGSSCGDHRIAMALAVAALVAEGGMLIEEAEAAEVSFPGFYARLRALVGRS
jgi:3-phosphoshikimate 1-carboxyvinyltransferase